MQSKFVSDQILICLFKVVFFPPTYAKLLVVKSIYHSLSILGNFPLSFLCVFGSFYQKILSFT